MSNNINISLLRRKIGRDLNYNSIGTGLSNLDSVEFKKINILDDKVNEVDIIGLSDYREKVSNPLISFYRDENSEIIFISDNDGSDDNNGTSRDKAFKTIQKGIDSLPDEGGIILVYPGSYSLSQSLLIDQKDSNISILGVKGSKYTIITRPEFEDDNDDYRLLTIRRSPNVYINGFTFENGHTVLSGNDTYESGNGGAILITDNEDPPNGIGAIIEDCLIKNCFAAQYGGGIHINDKRGTISRCIVDSCNCTVSGLNGGGGISLRFEGYARNCLVINCNTIYGAILCHSGICQVHNCTVADNGPNSSGIVLFNGSSPGHQVYNCISDSNAPNDISVVGGNSDIQNCISSEGVGTNGTSTFTGGFINKNESDYRIPYNSNAIDYGIDLPYQWDLDKERKTSKDIGCYNFIPKYLK